MRIVASCLLLFVTLLSSGCAIWREETTNRGGYLDYVLDQHWFKADSKRMRALRAFAIELSLARIASVSSKNQTDRVLLASRIGSLTTQFSVALYACALKHNPLNVPGAEGDPCFYYDSAMVEYSTGLFDLAMVALPIQDAKNLVNVVAGSAVNPLNFIDLLNALIVIGRDALNYGRIVGALYRDTIELEVQLWLATPAIDDRPLPARVTEDDVAPLRAIYAQGNDDMPAWIAAIAALRNRGLEPLPDPRFFLELNGLLNYVCDLIYDKSTDCKINLPKVPLSPAVSGSAMAVTVKQSASTATVKQIVTPAPQSPPRQPPVSQPAKAPVNNQSSAVAQLQSQYATIRAQIDKAIDTINKLQALAKQNPNGPAPGEAKDQIDLQILKLKSGASSKLTTLLGTADQQTLNTQLSSGDQQKLGLVKSQIQGAQADLDALNKLIGNESNPPPKAGDKPASSSGTGN